MALTDRKLELFGDRAVALIQAFEQDTIADIAKRVKKTGRFTETAELMALAMRNAGVSTPKIRAEVMKLLRADKAYQKEVANNTKQYKRDVIHRIRQMQKDALLEGNRIIAEAGDMAFNKDLWAWHQAGKELTKDSAIIKLLEEMQKETAGTFKNITKSMGFKGAHDFTAIQNAYYNALDKTVLKVATGTFSFDQALEACVRELAQSGLRSIDYASGRTYQLDTAVRMCVRTSCHQLSTKISMRNCETTGTDLVEVSSHWGAREEHAAWQGKIYSRSGKHKKYPDFKVCRYGDVDGLCGINCRHIIYPFFEGISEPNKWEPEPAPKKYNGKTYTYTEATQKQRQLERNVRATKREIEAQKSIGGDTKLLEAKKRKQIKEYHAFSNAMGIRAKDNRLRVVKGSSELKQLKNIEVPRVNNIKVKNATESFEIVLANSKGNRKLVNSMNLYYDSTDMIRDNNLQSAFTYSVVRDKIIYNPNADYFSEYDMNYVFAHEFAHRMDVKEIHSWNNKRFMNAIEIASVRAYNERDKFEELFTEHSGYENDGALSDILSALTDGALNDILYLGHSTTYWTQDLRNKPMEIFANLCSIELNEKKSKKILEKYFPDLILEFERML